jgi:alkaline phosphatase D
VRPISRRRFLASGSALLVGGVLAACRDSSGSASTTESAAPPSDATTTSAPTTAAATTSTTSIPELPGNPFTLGVASGDPLEDAVILWTRLAPAPLTPGGTGGMPAETVDVSWEVAEDEAFTTVVASGSAAAGPDHAHTVHVDVTGLSAGTTYWYRFSLGPYRSPSGRTRTMASADDPGATLVLGHASCQHYETGFYAAHRDIAGAELDALVWLGDYVYEGAARAVGEGNGTVLRSHDGPEPADVAGYRNRYALYRGDPDLQAAHASTPWFVIWDDHEVENDYAGDASQDAGVAPEAFRLRRAAAYQAWWEHQPVRLPAPNGAEYEMRRQFALGSLGTLFLLDGRQHRTDQACGDVKLSLDPPCPETFDPARTMLGAEQEQWLLDGLAASRSTWNILGNQTVMADLTLNGAVLNFDQWDGYPAARQRLLDAVDQGGVANVVTLTGDIHAAGVADLTVEDENGRRAVATELVTSSVSSTSNLPVGAEAILAQFPDVRFADGTRRGWVRNTVTQDAWEAEYRAVEDVADPGSPIAVTARFRIDAGTPGALRQDR